jgi:hypothetical protein
MYVPPALACRARAFCPRNEFCVVRTIRTMNSDYFTKRQYCDGLYMEMQCVFCEAGIEFLCYHVMD